MAEVVKKFKPDRDGAFVHLRYLQVEDPYYQHWLETSGGGNFYHHLCVQGLKSCQRKVGRDAIVHVQHWLAVDSSQVKTIVRGWKTKPLNFGAPKAPRGRSLVEEPVQTAPKARPEDHRRRHRSERPRSPGDGQGRRRRSARSPAREDLSEDSDVGRSNARRPERRTERGGSDDDSREGRRGVPKSARGTVGAVSRAREARDKRVTTPLDAMLDDDDDLGLPGKSKAEDRFEELRKALELKKKKAETKGSASAVLVKRVQESREGQGQKRNKSEQEMLTEALKALGKKKKDGSTSSGSGSEDEEDDGLAQGSKDGSLMSKQKRLKKMSSSKPGCLLAKGFGLMHEQLGTLFGDKGSGTTEEDLLQPAALRYLLSSALPLMDPRKVGDDKLRELRTLASALDLLVSGCIGQAGDTLMQRYKSLLMGIRDGSSAASRYLELIPMETYPTAATLEESDFARNLAVKYAKSQRLLDQVQTKG